MVKYVVKRVLYGLFTLFLVASATFALMKMVPGDSFLSENAASPAVTKAMERAIDPNTGADYGYMFAVIDGYDAAITDAAAAA